MATLPRYRQDILDNPVQRAERAHLRRGGISRFWWIIYVVTILTIVIPLLMGFTPHFFEIIHNALGVLLFLNVVTIFVVEMRIISQSAESIRREFQGKTWELLILTGVDTWRLILGKWLGTIYGNRREILFIYVLRVTTLLWGMIIFFLDIDGYRYSYYPSDRPIANLFDIRFDAQALIAGSIIMALFLVLEVMLVASLPIVFSLFKKTRKSAAGIALGLRIGVPIAVCLFVFWSTGELRHILGSVERVSTYSDRVWYEYSPEVDNGIMSLASVLSDNGFIWAASSVDMIYLRQGGSLSLFYISQIIGIGLYLLWIWIMLRMAKAAAYAHNVNARGFIPKVKPKRLIKTDKPVTSPSSAQPTARPKQRSPRQTNLLGIQNPALYHCVVMTYDRQNSKLEVAVFPMTTTTPELMVHFSGVSFFTGWMNWTNAKFEQLENKHLRQYVSNKNLVYDRLPRDSKLYVVQSQGNRTRIIATSIRIEVLSST